MVLGKIFTNKQENNISLYFAESMVTRICHDLAGCVSSISNSIEFISSPDMAEQATSLLSDASAENIAKLKLYRLLFGTIKNDGSADAEELQSPLKTLYKNIDMEFMWGETYLSAIDRKLLGHMIFAAISVMIYGGSITINRDNLSISCQFDKYKEDNQLDVLGGAKYEYTPYNVQYYYLQYLATESGYQINMDITSNSLNLYLTK